MKIKRIAIGALAVTFLTAGLWGTAAAIPHFQGLNLSRNVSKGFIAKKYEDEDKKESQRKKRQKTKFAMNTIKANQLLLMSNPKKVAKK